MLQPRLQSVPKSITNESAGTEPDSCHPQLQGCHRVTSDADQAAPELPEGLTDKQCEALDLVLCHMSSKEIAQHLGVSPRAIDQRLDAARTKLNAATRLEAAKIYRRHKLRPTCDQLTSEPITLPPSEPRQHDSGGAEDEPGFTLADAGVWMDTPRKEEFGSPGTVELKPFVLGKGVRFGLIIAGALAMVILVLILLAVAQGLEVIVPS